LIVYLVFLPLVAAIIAGLGGRFIGKTAAKLVTILGLFGSCALAWPIFMGFVAGHATSSVTPVLHFISSGTLSVDWALRVDALTAVILVVVTSVSSLVHLYSWGYMEEDPHQPRFFAYLSLFTFAMLMLVTADSLVQMFFGWEGVGLASYLLIGFWYEKPSACAAAMKAFIVNRVGDFGFSLGIFGVFLVFGSVSVPFILGHVADHAGQSIGFLGMRVDVITLLCILLFIGACGKSAQLGLHTWLPDAMEGPTPVSALIHAATMVTAGVFMVCRLSPLFAASAVASQIVIYTGAATCFFAATVGTTQTDIKRVIAYSTCSQLGYMFFAAGVGAYGAAMFHLFTHAFFKALLFLGAGSVIHAMHHEQDMRYYGGLAKKIPITFWVMMAGTLAITGVGVGGIFGFAGFYSKDAIIEAAYAHGGQAGLFAYWAGVVAALLTSFYSWRLIFLTFFGKPRWAQSEHIQHAVHDSHAVHDAHDTHAAHNSHAAHDNHAEDGTAGYHPHESPWVMLLPILILSIGAVFAGWYFAPTFLTDGYWQASVASSAELMEAREAVPLLVKLSATIVMLLGLVTAYLAYIRFTSLPAQFTKAFRPLYLFLLNKWYWDELYDFLFVKPAFALGCILWKRGDEGTIDRFGPNGVAALVQRYSDLAVRLQSGLLASYAFAMLLGLVAIVSYITYHIFMGVGR
jgi:NADH-quinone oxidoreductase subunit L